MDTTSQLNSLDQSSLQNLIGGSTTNLIPDSLVSTLTIGFIALNVVSILFLIAYIFGIVRKWKVQSAVLRMQKDLAEIKAHMIAAPAAPVVAPADEPTPEPQTDHEQAQS